VTAIRTVLVAPLEPFTIFDFWIICLVTRHSVSALAAKPVSATPGQDFPPGYMGSSVQGTFPPDLLPFLVPLARTLNRWGWDVVLD
jgi:hypothetical protein